MLSCALMIKHLCALSCFHPTGNNDSVHLYYTEQYCTVHYCILLYSIVPTYDDSGRVTSTVEIGTTKEI